jgi:hypothetical protein
LFKIIDGWEKENLRISYQDFVIFISDAYSELLKFEIFYGKSLINLIYVLNMCDLEIYGIVVFYEN